MDAQQIIELDIDLLQTNPLQPRGLITPESLVELVDSIREHGILEPLVVAHTPAGYQIIAGERRWRASKIAGLSNVPCVIKQTNNRGMLEMAIVENVQRVDLNPLERAQAFKRLVDEFQLTSAEVAKRISKSPSYVSNTLRILNLPDALKDALLTGLVTEGHIRALAGIDNEQEMVEALRQVLKESASVRRAEELTRLYKHANPEKHKNALKIREAWILSDDLTQMGKDIAKATGAKIRLTQSRAEGKLVIVFKGELEFTNKAIKKLHHALVEEFSGETS